MYRMKEKMYPGRKLTSVLNTGLSRWLSYKIFWVTSCFNLQQSEISDTFSASTSMELCSPDNEDRRLQNGLLLQTGMSGHQDFFIII
jgi:hypothetical protein